MHKVVAGDGRYSNRLKSKYDSETDRFTVVDMSKCYCELLKNAYIDTPRDVFKICRTYYRLLCHNCIVICTLCRTITCKDELTSCKICRQVKIKYDSETDRFTVVDMSKCYCELLKNVYITTPNRAIMTLASGQRLVCHNCITSCRSCHTITCKNKLNSCKICKQLCNFCYNKYIPCNKCAMELYNTKFFKPVNTVGDV
jgi:hypothetical protein